MFSVTFVCSIYNFLMLGIWWGEGHSGFISFSYVLNVRSKTLEKLLSSSKENQDASLQIEGRLDKLLTTDLNWQFGSRNNSVKCCYSLIPEQGLMGTRRKTLDSWMNEKDTSWSSSSTMCLIRSSMTTSRVPQKVKFNNRFVGICYVSVSVLGPKVWTILCFR